MWQVYKGPKFIIGKYMQWTANIGCVQPAAAEQHQQKEKQQQPSEVALPNTSIIFKKYLKNNSLNRFPFFGKMGPQNTIVKQLPVSTW